MKGRDIVDIIEAWLSDHNVHPDDFDSLFAKELLDLLDKDN